MYPQISVNNKITFLCQATKHRAWEEDVAQSDFPQSWYCFTTSSSGERMGLAKKFMSHMLYVTSPVVLGMADSTHYVLNYCCLALNTENKPTDFRTAWGFRRSYSQSSIFLDSASVNPSKNLLKMVENQYLSWACRTVLLLFPRQYHCSSYWISMYTLLGIMWKS